MTRLLRLLIVAVLLASSGTILPGQTPATGAFMREKLEHSQKILNRSDTSDFAQLERHSADLARATTAPGWAVLNSPEYVMHSASFRARPGRLVRRPRATTSTPPPWVMCP